MDKLIAFLVLLLMAGGIILIIVVARHLIFGKRIQQKKLAQYHQDLKRFNGSPTVLWELDNNSDMPTKDQLIADAAHRGYDLDGITAKGHTAQTLVFKKTDINLVDRVAR